jgi:hypothetical protein
MNTLGTKTWNTLRTLPFALALVSCVAPVGVSNVSVPPDAAKTCASHCESIGLRLSAVAIMANNVGCVCDAKSASPNAQTAQDSSPAAGMATLVVQEEEARQARAQANATAK